MVNFNVLDDYLTLVESKRMMLKLANNVSKVPVLGGQYHRFFHCMS
jgi:hypothetical protein